MNDLNKDYVSEAKQLLSLVGYSFGDYESYVEDWAKAQNLDADELMEALCKELEHA